MKHITRLPNRGIFSLTTRNRLIRRHPDIYASCTISTMMSNYLAPSLQYRKLPSSLTQSRCLYGSAVPRVSTAHRSLALARRFLDQINLLSVPYLRKSYSIGTFPTCFKKDGTSFFHPNYPVFLILTRLSPAKSTTVRTDLHLDKVPTSSSGEFSTPSLSEHLNTPQINQLVVRTYLHLAEDRRSTLVFCVDLNHVDHLTESFRNAGLDARSISSMSKSTYRRETLEAFGRGEFPVLVNCEVLTEGTDIPVVRAAERRCQGRMVYHD